MMAKKSKPTRREFVLMNKNAPFQYQEAYKSLRTNLNFMAMGKACKKLIFTSAIPGEGKSSVALNLAVSLAETCPCDRLRFTQAGYPSVFENR